jgi:two-component system sensor histidine kinase TctE
VRRLSQELQARAEGDLTPLPAAGAPRELLPLVDATNEVMSRLAHMLDNQKRFVRDTSHQLRTPLAVLKAQVQSALRGDIDARQALEEIREVTVPPCCLTDAVAKVEQLRSRPTSRRAIVGGGAGHGPELAPLVADKDIEFDIESVPAAILAHEWMLRELARNLLHNAIKHTPAGGTLSVRVLADSRTAALVVSDSGPGIPAELQPRLFQPFSAGDVRSGSGLGLAICQEIVRALGGTIQLENREKDSRVTGLNATVRLPLADNRD